MFLLPFVMNKISLVCLLSRKASGFGSPRWSKSHQNNTQWRSHSHSLEGESKDAKVSPVVYPLYSFFCPWPIIPLLRFPHLLRFFFFFCICFPGFLYLPPEFEIKSAWHTRRTQLPHPLMYAANPITITSKSICQPSQNSAQNLLMLETIISIGSKSCA